MTSNIEKEAKINSFSTNCILTFMNIKNLFGIKNESYCVIGVKSQTQHIRTMRLIEDAKSKNLY